jgi:hypothetical protein
MYTVLIRTCLMLTIVHKYDLVEIPATYFFGGARWNLGLPMIPRTKRPVHRFSSYLTSDLKTCSTIGLYEAIVECTYASKVKREIEREREQCSKL